VNDLIVGKRPDLVLSGVYRGENLAEDVTLSGTVAGAIEGMAMGVPSGMPSGMPSGPMPSGPPSFGSSDTYTQPVAPSGAFYAASAASPPQQNTQPTARREMAGPSGVDDILKTFEEVRRAEMSMSSQPANGYATQPAVAAASVMSDTHESAQTGATSQRRRKRTAPVGNTISLNV
jgi:hypothetical protein